ncbi:MAG: flavodoxin family protein [Verrucomicrobiota bacterium]|jgi:multimeric flavodoxin WrbA|nr:flavodoxin family protein [Verrucomicrobiota bacterium]
MKVIAFNGSPRKDGNTAILLRKVLSPIARAGIDTELVQVGGQPVRGCCACGRCGELKNRRCVIETDPVNEWIGKMLEADAIIMGSPTYFSGMTAELKALSDRSGFVSVVNGRLFARKIGAAVAVHRRGGAVNVVDSINHMFLMSRMIVPGSTYWNFGVGRLPGEVERDTEAIDNMHDLGETIAWLIKKIANPA